MALFPMEQMTGASGSGITERVLWTNASPTAAFGSATVSIADYISNYDFIKVYFGISKTTPTTMSSVVIPVDEFKTMTNQASSVGDFTRGASSISRVSSTYRTRSFYYVSETQIGFYAASNLAATGSSNDYVIPIKISGLKVSSQANSAPTGLIFGANSSNEVYSAFNTVTTGTQGKSTIICNRRGSVTFSIAYRYFKIYWDGTNGPDTAVAAGTQLDVSDCDAIFAYGANSCVLTYSDNS